MIPIVTPEQMARLDRWAIDSQGIPASRLMEAAGGQVARRLLDSVKTGSTVILLAGPGNNGGDAFVTARDIASAHPDHYVLFVGNRETLSAEARYAYESYCERVGGARMVTVSQVGEEVRALLGRAACIVDGLFGTGLKRPIEGVSAELIECANQNAQAFKIAIDIPSGLDGGQGRLLGAAFRADVTVTFQCPKRGFFVGEGPSRVGRVEVADIGIPLRAYGETLGDTVYLEASDFDLKGLFKRDWASFKKRHGHVVVIGGSPGMVGANCLASRAAFRVGAGLVTAVFPQTSLRGLGRRFVYDCLVSGVRDRDGEIGRFGRGFLKGLSDKAAVAVGCGLNVKPQALAQILKSFSGPVIIDAGALQPFAVLNVRRNTTYGSAIVATPHVGEMAKMTGVSKEEILRDRLGHAQRWAQETGARLILKGAYSVLALPQGRVMVNGSGNPGMATAGMGDVLTGMLAGILGQPFDLNLDEKVALAMWMHGAVGDFCAKRLGQVSMMASDVVEAIPAFLLSKGVE